MNQTEPIKYKTTNNLTQKSSFSSHLETTGDYPFTVSGGPKANIHANGNSKIRIGNDHDEDLVDSNDDDDSDSDDKSSKKSDTGSGSGAPVVAAAEAESGSGSGKNLEILFTIGKTRKNRFLVQAPIFEGHCLNL